MSWKRPAARSREDAVSGDLARFGLTPRLAAVAELVPRGASVVDLGTDHGLLPIALAGTKRANAVGVDSSRDALRAARANRARFGVHVELICADRPPDADVLVLAGLGGRTICNLLRPGFARVIVQPNTDLEAVRRRLAAVGYAIEKERFVPDGDRFFVVIAADAGVPHELTLEAAFIGAVRDDPLFSVWAEIQRTHLERKSDRARLALLTASADS